MSELHLAYYLYGLIGVMFYGCRLHPAGNLLSRPQLGRSQGHSRGATLVSIECGTSCGASKDEQGKRNHMLLHKTPSNTVADT